MFSLKKLIPPQKKTSPCPEGNKFFTCLNTSLICWESVTSIWNVFSLSLVIDFKSSAPCFVKQAANTWTPILSKRMAVSRPKPESHPVMKTYLVCKFCTFRFARNFKLNHKTMRVTAPARSKVWFMLFGVFVAWERLSDPMNRRIHADVIVYIFSHLHTALRTEGWIDFRQAKQQVKLSTWWKFLLFWCNIQGEIVFQKLQNFWVSKALMGSFILC